jgi:diguanylate cyclase (GGDEF)-like protein
VFTAQASLQERLRDGLLSMGVTPVGDQVSDLTHFLRMLEKWNHAFNLTAIRDPDEMVALHVLDSVTARPFLEGVSVLDAGTGAGLPGIPLAVLEPERHFLLLDSGGKKVRFVRHAVGELAVENVTVVQARIEDYEPTVLFDTVICRALSSLGKFVRGCGRFAGPGGRLVAMKGRSPDDELTGLPNRGLFTEQLARAIGRSQRKTAPLAVLFIDLDRFKSVNDTLGHDTGDELLRLVAGRLRKNLRIGDFSGRWGGDEFVVCLEDFGESNNAAAAAQKLLLVLSEKYEISNSEVYATPSIGIAIFPESGEAADRLIKAADLAMYEAKKRGGGRFQYYSAALNTKLEQREELEIGLRHALVRNEFILHYQPRIDLTTGRLIGLEALLRWQHPRFGLLPPGRFLPILESSGLIHSAGEWVINTSCRQLAAWQRQFELPDLSIAVNLSPQQLIHQRLVDIVSESLENTALDPGCIELEIGDGDIVRQRTAELQTLQRLRKLGVRISLDHFGTRDVSFESLDNGFIDSFVLDQSLIQDIDENDSHQRIVRAAIAMAQGLDIEVAAEGVETLTQLDFLRSCNCDLAQGFLISRPMQSKHVSAVLRSEIAGTRLLSRGMP